MIWVAALLGGLGIGSMILRGHLLGAWVGIQLIFLGVSMGFVMAGAEAGAALNGHVFGIFVVLGGVVQLAAGYALTVRLFYLKKDISMRELRTLKE